MDFKTKHRQVFPSTVGLLALFERPEELRELQAELWVEVVAQGRAQETQLGNDGSANSVTWATEALQHQHLPIYEQGKTPQPNHLLLLFRAVQRREQRWERVWSTRSS